MLFIDENEFDFISSWIEFAFDFDVKSRKCEWLRRAFEVNKSQLNNSNCENCDFEISEITFPS